MTILVFGAGGFIGRHVTRALKEAGHDVRASVHDGSQEAHYKTDLSNIEDISRVLLDVNPDVIVNCAGVVDNSERASLNVIFTENIFEAMGKCKLPAKKVIVTGSAAEYGFVKEQGLVSETTSIQPVSTYGIYKAQETKRALELGTQLGIHTIVVRLFNPLGTDMNSKMLLPSLIGQVSDIKSGTRSSLEISRLDSFRDYVDVRDVAEAYRALLEKDVEDGVYNVGSGIASSNKTLVELLLAVSGLPKTTPVQETNVEPEEPVACQADITHIHRQTGWDPEYSLKDTIEGVYDTGHEKRK